MFRINEGIVFASVIVSLFIIALINGMGIAALQDLQTLLGIYLMFFPIGFLFVSAAIAAAGRPLTEILMLSMALSVALISMGLLIIYFALQMPLNFYNSAIVVGFEAVLFYALWFVRWKR